MNRSVPPNKNELTNSIMVLSQQVSEARQQYSLGKDEYVAQFSMQQALERDLQMLNDELLSVEEQIRGMRRQPAKDQELEQQILKLTQFIDNQQHAIAANEQKLAKLTTDNEELNAQIEKSAQLLLPIPQEAEVKQVVEPQTSDESAGFMQLQKMLDCLETQIAMQKVILQRFDE